MRLIGTAKELERQRLRAITALQKGYRTRQVAEIVGVSPRSVQRWEQAFREKGKKGLLARPHPGKSSKLSEKQKEVLIKELLKGAQVHGYPTDLWTGPRIAHLIQRKFGTSYHPRYVPQMLGSMRWSCQRPEGQPLERNQKGVRRWITKDWPRIKKSPAETCYPCLY